MILGAAVAALGLLATAAGAAGAPAPARARGAAAAAPAMQAAGAAVTRADLAAAYLRFEAAWAERPLQGEARLRMNRRFDALATSFFNGDFAAAARGMNDLRWELWTPAGGAGPSAAQRAAEGLKVAVEPAVLARGATGTVRVTATAMYLADRPAGAGAGPLRVTVRAVGPVGAEAWRTTFELDASRPEAAGVAATVPLPADVALGLHTLMISGEPSEADKAGAATREVPVGRWHVVESPRAEARRAAEAALDALDAAGGGNGAQGPLASAKQAARARAGLLSDAPSEGEAAEFLADQHGLGVAVKAEIAALERGEDPYAGRAGDWWLALSPASVGGAWPMRVYAPGGALGAAHGRGLPLVIALHGAGGDENMFFDGYGAGRVKSLADRHGFLVVAPRTEFLGAAGAPLADLLEALGRWYPIDRERVYVVGHSMGGGAAALIARRHIDRVAGVVCIAGGPQNPVRRAVAPMLVLGAELDRIILSSRLRTAAERSTPDAPIEFRQLDGEGHVLVVGAAIEPAIDWLLAKRLEARPAAAAPPIAPVAPEPAPAVAPPAPEGPNMLPKGPLP